MIAVQEVVNRIRAALDAEGSTYYDFDIDIKPAIQQAQEFLIYVVDTGYQSKKFSDDVFADLMYTRVFQTSVYSRIFFDSAALGHEVWTITSVEPRPTTTPSFTTSPTARAEQSVYRSSLAHLSSAFYASRKTVEEWNKNRNNPFFEGHELESGETAQYFGFLPYQNYSGTNYTGVTAEIEIRPALNREACTVRYARYPEQPNLITDNILFPKSFIPLLVAKSLNYISVKQGDNTTLASMSEKEVAQIVKTIL